MFLLLLSTSNAQSYFVENKGQWPDSVRFRLGTTQQQVYFENQAFTFNLIDGEAFWGSSVHHGAHETKPKNLERVIAHAYQMRFLGANPQSECIGVGAHSTYENWMIGNDPRHWGIKAGRYNEVFYKNLYPQIDAKVGLYPQGLKYDLIIKPGGRVSDIVLGVVGTDKIKILNGDLIIETSVGRIIEKRPYVYQKIRGRLIEIEAMYQLVDKKVTYKLLDDYDERYDLIIDPVLIFSTYSGSTSDNWGFTATSDLLGNVYSGGIVFNTGYPSTLGAYQYTFAGGEATSGTYLGCDITISKYSPDGTTLLWATHLGGTDSEEMPHSLVVNSFNDLIIFGTSGSSNYPVSIDAYDPTFNGGTSVVYDGVVPFSNGTDIVVSRLSSDGTQLVGSTYVGGAANDGLNYKPSYAPYLMDGNDSLYYNYADGARGEVIVDDKSDIFVGTTTFSSDFPTMNGFQLFSNGQQDGVVFKLSSDLSQMRWSSYIGGSNNDAVYSLEINDLGETYVAGGTSSSNLPTTTGAYRINYQGGSADGFVAHISTNGGTLLASTYFGSAQYDQAYFVRRDRYKNVYIFGQTKATGNTLIFNAAYNQPNSGQFIAKFLPGLTTLDWSTVFGTGSGKPNISPTAFSVDICNRVYLAGWGREWGGDFNSQWGTTFGTVGMQITPDAQQSVTDGQDFYLMVMFGDASALDYASFFGEQHYGTGYCGHDHVDGGTSRFDRMGNIYQSVCASCGNAGATGSTASCNEFPTTTGSYSENNGGYPNLNWNCNNAVFRFSFAEDITVADFYAEPLVCEGTAVPFTNTGTGANYYWNFGDGSPVSNAVNPTHVFPSPGIYQVTLMTIDSNTCNLSDTIVKTITIQDHYHLHEANDTICQGDDITIGTVPESNHSYQWYPASGLSNPFISNPIASPNVTTNYVCVIDDGICLDSLSQTVVVRTANYTIQAHPDTLICYGESVQLSVSSTTTLSQVVWATDPAWTQIINTGGQATVNVQPSQTTTYYVQTLESVCQLIQTDSVVVQVDRAQIEILGEDSACMGAIGSYSAQIQTGSISQIIWRPNAQVISGQGTNLITANLNMNFWLVAEGENNNQCAFEDSIYIFVDQIDLTATPTSLLCFGECTGSILLTPHGVQAYSYIWNDGNTSQNRYNLCAGTYRVTLTDGLSCTDTMQVNISEPTELHVQITNVNSTGCGSDWNTGSALVQASGGTAPYQYLWSHGDTDSLAQNLYVGTFSVTVTDANQCQKTLSVQITDLSPLQTDLNAIGVSCHNECDAQIQAVIVIPSTSPYSYAWSNGGSASSLTQLCSGNYTVTVQDAQQCVRIMSVFISNPEPVDAQISAGHQACHGDLTQLTALVTGGSSPYYFEWSTGSHTNPITQVGDGTYQLTVTDAHGCTDTTQISIESPELIQIDTATTLVNCDVACNGSAQIDLIGGIPPYQYLWDNGSVTSHTSGLCKGLHTVSVQDANGCVLVDSVQINVNPNGAPVSASSNPYSIYKGESSQLTATFDSTYTYIWTPIHALTQANIWNPISKPYSTIIYQVQITDVYGCVNSDTTIVRVKDFVCDEPYIFIPNAFSPNNDGQNDVLLVRGEVIETMHLSIYDRWGEKVFETEHVNQGWDGIYQGKPADPAVFVYHLTATCVNKAEFKKQGNITLIR